MGWSQRTVGDLITAGEAELQTGPFGTQLHAGDYVKSGTPVINVRNIGFGQLRPEKLEFVDDATVARLSGHVLRVGDIVFGRKGAVERHVFVRREQDGWLQGSDCLRVRFRGSAVEPLFASYCFLTREHKEWIVAQAGHGVTMTSLNQDIIGRIHLLLPPIQTQRKIAAILSAYDDLIENNTRRVKILEEMAQALYREWFVQCRFPGHEGEKMVATAVGRAPQRWPVTAVIEAVEVDPRTYVPKEGEKPFVLMDGLSTNSMLISNVQSRAGNGGSKFMNGDTLFARITPCLENGKIGFVQFLPSETHTAFGSTEFIVLRSRSLCPEYVYLMARTHEFRDNAIKSMVGVSGRQRVQPACFEKFLIAHPDPATLASFQELVAPTFRLVQILARRNDRLRSARDLLLPKLISGEIDVSDLDIDVAGAA